MHELALAQGVVEIVEAQARASAFVRVRRVHLTIGALAPVEPEALALGFQVASQGTVAEGAELRIARPPGAAQCMQCGARIALGQRGDPCPQCDSHQVLVTGGEELKVSELEVE